MITGKAIRSLMLKHKVTIRELSERLGITMQRIREIRTDGISDPNVQRDWVQAITGEDPGPPPRSVLKYAIHPFVVLNKGNHWTAVDGWETSAHVNDFDRAVKYANGLVGEVEIWERTEDNTGRKWKRVAAFEGVGVQK